MKNLFSNKKQKVKELALRIAMSQIGSVVGNSKTIKDYITEAKEIEKYLNE